MCDRCQMPLPQGALHFVARLRLTGEMDGVTPQDEARPQDALQSALAAAERLSEEELLEGVVEEFSFTLCPGCRAQLRVDPAGASTVRPNSRRAPQ